MARNAPFPVAVSRSDFHFKTAATLLIFKFTLFRLSDKKNIDSLRKLSILPPRRSNPDLYLTVNFRLALTPYYAKLDIIFNLNY